MTIAECIHGLDPALCDICSPRPVPAATRAPVARTRTTAPRTTAPRTTAPRVAGSRGTAAEPPLPRVDLATQRAFHVTALDTLESIVADGALRADAEPVVELSSAATRELRTTTGLPDGSTAASRVAFYLDPQADRWTELRSGAVGPTWSDAARALRPTETAVLVTTVGALGDAVVLTDGDAAGTVTRFAAVEADAAAATALLRRLHSAPERLAAAEALGPGAVPLDRISLVVVANEPARERVRALLAGAGIRTKVSVNPPWFQPA